MRAVSSVVSVIIVVAVVISLSVLASSIVFDYSSQNKINGVSSTISTNVNNSNLKIKVIKGIYENITVIQGNNRIASYNNLVAGDSKIITLSNNKSVFIVYNKGDTSRVIRKIDLDDGTSSSSKQKVSVLAWNTSTDWDSAVKESGVAHEAVANTDHDDSSILQQGPSYSDIKSDSRIHSFWPFHEDTTGTVHEIINGTDGSTNNGVNTGVPGVARVTSHRYDRNDYTSVSSFTTPQEEITVMLWMKPDWGSSGDYANTLTNGRQGESFTLRVYQGPPPFWSIYQTDGDGISVSYNSGNVSSGEWTMATLTFNGTHAVALANDSVIDKVSNSGEVEKIGKELRFGRDDATNEEWVGNITDVRVYKKGLSTSEVKSIYNTYAKNSSLKTSKKSFNSKVKVDLNATYSLNGESVVIDVIGSPGTASEEIKTVKLDGSKSYDLSWSNNHKEYQLNVTFVEEKLPKSPTISSIKLEKSS